MNVDLRNFVQINLKYFQTKQLNRTRDTAVLLACKTLGLDETFKSFKDFEDKVSDALLQKYAKCFFKNGGIKLHLIAKYNPSPVTNYHIYNKTTQEWEVTTTQPTEGSHALANGDYYSVTSGDPEVTNYFVYAAETHTWTNVGTSEPASGNDVTSYDILYYSTSDSNPTKEKWLKDTILELDYDEIIITTDQSIDILKEIQQDDSSNYIVPNTINEINEVKTLSGYKEKLYIGSISNINDADFDSNKDWSNLVVKYGDPGIEMATAAYLTQVNIMNSKTIADYCFTIEDLSMFEDSSIVTDNSLFVSLSNKNINVDTILINEVRNSWGNTIAGHDLMNYYMRILLTQTLTERIMSVLASKIKYDKTGINKVINAMVQELNIYKNNGYLSVDDIWTEDDLYYTFNNVDYLVCRRNTPLPNGYKFTILPLSSLSTAQKQSHAFPPIYVLISDSISIRQIVISGDIY